MVIDMVRMQLVCPMYVSRIRSCISEQTSKKKSRVHRAEELDGTGKSLHGDNTMRGWFYWMAIKIFIAKKYDFFHVNGHSSSSHGYYSI